MFNKQERTVQLSAANDLKPSEPDPFVRLAEDLRGIEQRIRQLHSDVARSDTAPAVRSPSESRPWSVPDVPYLRAAAIYRDRRRRDAAFGEWADIFHDAAYDILLDLFIAEGERKSVSVSSLCIAAAVPATTALRTIGLMESRGMLVKYPDALDRRRFYVSLTPATSDLMRRWLSSLR